MWNWKERKWSVADVGMHHFLQVAASKTKIYMVLEFVDGGELFDKIVSHQNRVVDICFSCTNQCHMFSNALFFSLLPLQF